MIPDPRLQAEIGADETLLWQGTPNPARLAQRSTFMAIIGGFFTCFSLVWMGGAAFITFIIAGATGFKWVALAPLFGLIFLVVGLAMLFSPLTAIRRGANTVYAMTNRRLIIWENRTVKSFMADDLNTLERHDLPDSRGDVIFRRTTNYHSEGNSVQEAGFFGIQGAREVEGLIRQHLKN